MPFVLLGAAVGAAIALGTVWLGPRSNVAPPAVAAPIDDGVRGDAALQPAGANVDLSPVLRRLDEVAARLERLEGKVTQLSDAPVRTAVAGTAAPSVLDADTVLAALQMAEQKKLDALSDGELLQEARRLQKGGDLAAAQQRLQALLQRALTPDERGRAQMELGMVLRSRGDAESRAAAAAMFQSVVDANGLGSELGSQAGLQLVWTHTKGEDAAAGMSQAQLLVTTRGVPEEIRRNARWATGILAQGMGDAVRARTEYESLLREMDGQPEQAKLVADIRRRLGEL